MFTLFKKGHLKYNSVEEWMRTERIPELSEIKDSLIRDKYLTQYSELRLHLFKKHILTLSTIEQAQLKNGEHPSQSHSRVDAAKESVEAFKREFSQLKIVKEVGLGTYYGGRLVIDVFSKRKLIRLR